MLLSSDEPTSIVSSITSKHIQRIVIGFTEPVSDAILRDDNTSKAWGKFDHAITRLAERTLDNGRRLQLELHACGNPSVVLFERILPRFAETGNLKVVKTSYIWTGSILYRLTSSNRSAQFWLAFISGPSTHF